MYNNTRRVVIIDSDHETLESVTEPGSDIPYCGGMQDLFDFPENLYQVTVTNGELRNSSTMVGVSSKNSIVEPEHVEDVISVADHDEIGPTNTDKSDPT